MRGLLLGASLSILASASARAATLTGIYIGHNDHQAFVLQIVQSGAQLTGRFEEFDVKPGGKYQDATGAFSAAADGNSFAGAIKMTGLLSSTFPVSGELTGDTFRVDGDASFHLSLVRGDQAGFRAAVATLKSTASVAGRNTRLEDLIGQMSAFQSRLLQATDPLPGLEAKLAADTARMSSTVAKERAMEGDGQASVERGQLSVSAHQIGVDAAQTRATVDASLAELHPVSQRLVGLAALARIGCHPEGATAVPLPACGRFNDADIALKRSIETGKAEFAKFDEVWERESSTQASLMQQSDAAVR